MLLKINLENISKVLDNNSNVHYRISIDIPNNVGYYYVYGQIDPEITEEVNLRDIPKRPDTHCKVITNECIKNSLLKFFEDKLASTDWVGSKLYEIVHIHKIMSEEMYIAKYADVYQKRNLYRQAINSIEQEFGSSDV